MESKASDPWQDLWDIEAIMKGRKRIRPADDSRLQKQVVMEMNKPRNLGWQKRYMVG
jgi:hypothetical protein